MVLQRIEDCVDQSLLIIEIVTYPVIHLHRVQD